MSKIEHENEIRQTRSKLNRKLIEQRDQMKKEKEGKKEGSQLPGPDHHRRYKLRKADRLGRTGTKGKERR